jgi:hypothetical protein
MWLINTHTLTLEEFIGPNRPSFAILSHTWGKDEVTFQEFRSSTEDYSKKLGGQKIINTCALAKSRGFHYVWIDSCCIDKTNSVELAEAINSMFEWYAAARECYVYIQDLGPDAPIGNLKGSRWFTRGWTLQELLAPDNMIFFDRDWRPRGTKRELSSLISEATGISQEILQDKSLLSQVPVSHKMSWAASRQTTRPEDIAYCLIGIFDVKMIFIYGEGRKNSFYRLQEEIIRRTNDMSIFAWRSLSVNEKYSGVLATGPEVFVNGSLYRQTRGALDTPEYAITNKGIRIDTGLQYTPSGDTVMSLHHSQGSHDKVGIYLKAYGGRTYARMRPHELANVGQVRQGQPEERYLTPSASVAIERKLDTTRENAFLFNSSLETEYWQYESTVPSTWWDHDTKSYLRDSNKPFAAFHFFRSDWHDTSPSLKFVVAFGVTEGGRAWARIDSDHLYKAIVNGQMHLVQEDIDEYVQLNKSSHVAISRRNPPQLVRTCSTEDGVEVCKDTLHQTVSTFHLKVFVVSTMVHGYATFAINMTAERPSEPMLGIMIWFTLLFAFLINIFIFLSQRT